jgi:hypothetical protein
MEIAYVDVDLGIVTATGTQIGRGYELRYALYEDRLELHVIGGPTREFSLGDADFFDLAFSPLFNSLPVRGDELLEVGCAHDYDMRWVTVPELGVEPSRQRYEPLGDGRVRFRAGSFVSDLVFDDDGLIIEYPGVAERVTDVAR